MRISDWSSDVCSSDLDEIAEPLVRDLMRLHRIDRLPRRVARDPGIVEQDALEGEDRAPIFHRAEKLRLAGPRDIVELGQRIGLAEIVAVIAEQRAETVEHEARLLARPLGRQEADPDQK